MEYLYTNWENRWYNRFIIHLACLVPTQTFTMPVNSGRTLMTCFVFSHSPTQIESIRIQNSHFFSTKIRNDNFMYVFLHFLSHFSYRQSTICWVHARQIDQPIQRKSVPKIFSQKWTRTTTGNWLKMNFSRDAYKTKSCRKCWHLKQIPRIFFSSETIPFAYALTPKHTYTRAQNCCTQTNRWRKKTNVKVKETHTRAYLVKPKTECIPNIARCFLLCNFKNTFN